MRKIIAVLLLLSVASCREEPITVKPESSMEILSKNHALSYRTVTEVTYEGCEYIIIENGNGTWGSHKGNCKNLRHQQ
jgi:hypothetical protein